MEMDFTSDVVEKLLLKRALIDKKWMNILSSVYDERWFKVPYMAMLTHVVLKYYEKYASAPSTQIIQALVKKYAEKHPSESVDMTEANALISEVTTKDFALNEDVINSNLKEFIRKNAFIQSLNDNIDILAATPNEKSSEKYEQIIDKCLENFDRVQKITFSDTDLGLKYFDEKAMAEHWNAINNPDAKIKTGWDSVDYYTNGGVLKDGRMLGLFMAQAGLGKSVFLSNLTVNFLKQNLNVVVISLEMSEQVYASRFDAHISRKNVNKLRENQEVAINRIKDFYKEHPGASLIIKEFPPRSVSTKDIQAYLETLKNNGQKIDVLVIDYLNLVVPNRKTDSMFKDGLSVSEELRGLSYAFNVPVMSAVQCNSEGMGTDEIDMQNISESRGIAHTADFIAAIFQKQEDRENGILGFKIVKNRLGGQVGKCSRFKMDAETLTLADLTFDNAPNQIEPKDSDRARIYASFESSSNDPSLANL